LTHDPFCFSSRRRHTRFSRDWSSDVCSSDLTGSNPKRARPRSIDDGTMPATVRQAILERIDADDPDGARVLLDGIDAALSPEARSEERRAGKGWRIRWSR